MLVADVYAAGEALIDGADKAALVAGLSHGHKAAVSLEGAKTLAPEIAARTSPGDVVMCLGAGHHQLGKRAPSELDELIYFKS